MKLLSNFICIFSLADWRIQCSDLLWQRIVIFIAGSRILSLVSQLLNIGASGGGRIQLPPGVSTVSDELQKTCASFMRIVAHNRAVFSQRYVDIIKSLEEAREQGSNGS